MLANINCLTWRYLAKGSGKPFCKYTGVPVCIGVGPTKTLSKVANRIAKKEKSVHVLNTPYKIETALKKTQIANVWDVESKYAVMLTGKGINTAFDLSTFYLTLYNHK